MDGAILSSVSAGSALDDGPKALRRLLLLAAIFVALVAATPLAYLAGGDNVYMGFAIATGLVAIAATRIAGRAPTVPALYLIIAVALLARSILLFADPLLSTDIYRYVWDGRVQAAGINPYQYFPAHEALSSLRDTAIYPRINRAEYAVTIYPPVAQMFYFLVTRLGESVLVMKLALLVCEAITVTIIIALLRQISQPITRVVAYLWHPLPIWEIANSGHVDALMIALMMAGIWCALNRRPTFGAIVIALGVLTKPFAALALTLTWRLWDWKQPVVVALVAALCYAPYLSVGWGALGFLGTGGYLHEEEFDTGNSIWLLAITRMVIGTVPGDVAVYFIGSVLILLGKGIMTTRSNDQLPGSRLVELNRLLLLFLFLMQLNYPWYFLLATPFVALVGGMPVWAMTLGAVLLQEEYWADWQIPVLARKSMLYGVFLVACAYEAWRRRQRRVLN